MTNVNILKITAEGIKDIVCFIGESIWLLYFIFYTYFYLILKSLPGTKSSKSDIHWRLTSWGFNTGTVQSSATETGLNVTFPELSPAHSEEALHTSCYNITFQVEIQVLPTGYFVPVPYYLSEESPTTCHLFNTNSSPFYSEGTEAQRGKVTLLESQSRHIGHQTWAIQLLSPSASPCAPSLTK